MWFCLPSRYTYRQTVVVHLHSLIIVNLFLIEICKNVASLIADVKYVIFILIVFKCETLSLKLKYFNAASMNNFAYNVTPGQSVHPNNIWSEATTFDYDQVGSVAPDQNAGLTICIFM